MSAANPRSRQEPVASDGLRCRQSEMGRNVNPNRPSPRINRGVLLSIGALPPAHWLATVTAQQAPSAPRSAFSFAVYGDSRPMMYLPYKEGQPGLNKMFVEMFGLVMPDKVAEAVVKRDVKTTFDPVTKELIQVVMPFESKTEVMTLTLDKG
jgi:hypothetical protein